MTTAENYLNERLDHLGIVAGVCQEIGLAAWLDAQDPDNRQQVSVGTATVAMILNGLGFSNRQLYLVPQYFANKPVEHLLGTGISADMLNDDCLGRTLDWLYAHDPTQLFAGIASRARQVFGISAHQVHVDTTSFSVSGAYSSADEWVEEPGKTAEAMEAQTALIAITYGYSRDHREERTAVDVGPGYDPRWGCPAVPATTRWQQQRQSQPARGSHGHPEAIARGGCRTKRVCGR
jgi:transposase